MVCYRSIRKQEIWQMKGLNYCGGKCRQLNWQIKDNKHTDRKSSDEHWNTVHAKAENSRAIWVMFLSVWTGQYRLLTFAIPVLKGMRDNYFVLCVCVCKRVCLSSLSPHQSKNRLLSVSIATCQVDHQDDGWYWWLCESIPSEWKPNVSIIKSLYSFPKYGMMFHTVLLI